MRLIVGITLLLSGVGMLSCRMENVAQIATASPVMWVRTVDGWERTDTWHLPTVERPRLHPFVVAAGQGLVSLWALAAFRRDNV